MSSSQESSSSRNSISTKEGQEILTEPENIEKMKEKHFREEEAAIKAYCEKHGIAYETTSPEERAGLMEQKAKERLEVSQHRTLAERKPLKDRTTIFVDPQNPHTKAFVQKISSLTGGFATGPSEFPHPSLAGRVKPSPIPSAQTKQGSKKESS
ncbi:MAG: hypothetical protein KDK55_03490 [Chlamydiia bacterium]|nr:hypothetical protein [Chlamydiia bacterium]